MHYKGETIDKVDKEVSLHVPKILVICDWDDTAPVWEYILRKQGLNVKLVTSIGKVTHYWSLEIPDLMVIDIDPRRRDPTELYKKFRWVSDAPILLLLPSYDEIKILDAYAAGVDEVIVKPVSPALFLAKILAWGRRGWILPDRGLAQLEIGQYRLDPERRSLFDMHGTEIRLTNLEFRLLHMLMSRPSHVFRVEEIIEFIWGVYGNGDPALLKNVVYRLRKKIEPDPSHPILLRSWRGGYSFQG